MTEDVLLPPDPDLNIEPTFACIWGRGAKTNCRNDPRAYHFDMPNIKARGGGNRG